MTETHSLPWRNIVLTGFMGTGKSHVGRLLAGRLGWEFVDTDAWIEAQTGRRVAAIFHDDGEVAFRAWEAMAAVHFGRGERQVIATGGRLLLDPANALDLAAGGLVLCLTATPETILARVRQEAGRRPLLEGGDPVGQIRRLLRDRADAYAQFPAVETDGHSPSEIAETIVAGMAAGRWPAARLPNAHTLPVQAPGGAYDVVVGADLLPDLDRWLTGPGVIVTDGHVGPLWAGACPPHPVITLPAGEAHKRLHTVRGLYDQLIEAGLDRAGAVIALGGGVIGDLAGFAAATYLRGVGFLPCPTTLLAMVDASVGGKTGVDLPQGKNLVGAFKQPLAVVADVATLTTLPAIEWRAGLAEVVKHGLIAAPALLAQLADPATDPAAPPTLPVAAGTRSLILRAIAVKRRIVEADPYESGRRAVLNLGHTFAHAVEQVSGYAVRHGDAVAMGLVAAAELSQRLGHAPAELPARVEALLAALSLPTHLPPLPADALLAAMRRDKKVLSGRLRFVLLRDVGDVFVTDEVPAAATLETLRARGAAD